MPVREEVLDLQRSLAGREARDVIAAIVKDDFRGRVAVACSFGTEAAALLHLVAGVDAATPILFIDTGRHFAETLRYRDDLSAQFGLKNVRSIGPTPDEIVRLDADDTRASWDPNGCCAFRKVAPLKSALAGFDA